MQHSALPRLFYRLHQTHALSRDAQRCLQGLDFYHAHGQNAHLTCHHFAIFPRAFYKWLHHFSPKDLTSLETHDVQEITLHLLVRNLPCFVQNRRAAKGT